MKFSAVVVLIAVNVAVYLLQRLQPELEATFALWPLQPLEGAVYFRPWQLVTYAFLHDISGFSHILFNMYGLWMFGTPVENHVGPRRFLACYFASVITAAATQLLVPIAFGAPPAPTIGASGGVFGLVLAYALLFPRQRVMLLIPPIPMPAWLFATLYGVLELFLGVTGVQSGIAHFAHLGGMVGSALVYFSWRQRLPPAGGRRP